MTPDFQYDVPNSPEDRQKLQKILEQCYICTPKESEDFVTKTGVDKFRIFRHNQEIIGGLASIPMGQWWGGETVPMVGIAAVGVTPEHRNGGVAIALMQQTLQELYHQGVPLSCLYPATQYLYRQVGYEQGGTATTWEIDTNDIRIKQRSLPVLPLLEINHQVLNNLYTQQAQRNNGNLNRDFTPLLWERLLEVEKNETVYTYLIGEPDKPQGYVIFHQYWQQDNCILKIRDFAVLTLAAAESLWSFLASHRSQVKKIRWKSSIVDSFSLVLAEQAAKIQHTERWMLRIINLVAALEKRGYPPELTTELHLQVEDDLLTANNGEFILAIANGKGKVTTGGKGDLHLDIRGLAPLYTGLFTPQVLQVAGKIQGTPQALHTAEQIFTRTSPWMSDYF
ncbi:GNAT family N-acetyltransferase [Calothrix sp. 336/3]|uniref:GNAT family N-acetyltransferase n=1 Tax=Calothrix sp. 336/3 TaxID=1337936 RepID=UPI0004E46D74|nr:GNAT family N-acetyltransferase [Calothrix sp. 336/3]AKG24774.1 acetyltransferase [Calothrix sp. 336/3]